MCSVGPLSMPLSRLDECLLAVSQCYEFHPWVGCRFPVADTPAIWSRSSGTSMALAKPPMVSDNAVPVVQRADHASVAPRDTKRPKMRSNWNRIKTRCTNTVYLLRQLACGQGWLYEDVTSCRALKDMARLRRAVPTLAPFPTVLDIERIRRLFWARTLFCPIKAIGGTTLMGR
jgi:hypothetical protein